MSRDHAITLRLTNHCGGIDILLLLGRIAVLRTYMHCNLLLQTE